MSRKQLVTSDQATVVNDQPTKPCSDCPWARAALPRWLGGLDVEQWLALAHSDSRADCHTLKAPDGHHRCAGLSVYRANVCKRDEDGDGLNLEQDDTRVFSTPGEFAAHHGVDMKDVDLMRGRVRLYQEFGDDES